MNLLPVFVDSAGGVRSGWRFAAYSILLVALFVATGTLLGALIAWTYPELFSASEIDIRLLALNAVALFIPSVGALLLMAGFVDHIPAWIFGVALHARWLRDFLVGLAVSAGMLAVALMGSFLAGAVEVRWTATSESLLSVLFTVGVLIVAAANEELVFRGYPLQVLMKGIGPWPAMVLLSSIFGLLHARNPGASPLSVLNTILAGVLLAVAYRKTRSLWFPYGIHLGWNSGLAVVLGFPVSGLNTPSLWTTHADGPEYILGGGYGPEAGLLGTLIFAAAAVAVLRIRAIGVSPELRDGLASYAGKVYIEEL